MNHVGRGSQAFPDYARQVLSNFWDLEQLFENRATSGNFCLYEQLLSNFWAFTAFWARRGRARHQLTILSDEGPMLETLDYTIRIGSTPTFLYFDLYLYSAYAAHYVYNNLVWLIT